MIDRIQKYVFLHDGRRNKKTGNLHKTTCRHFRLTIFSWKINKYYIFWVCVCRFKLSWTQRACAILYNLLWPVPLWKIFAHFLINSRMFGRKLLNIKCVICFSLHILSGTFLILKQFREVLSQIYIGLYIK